MRSKIIIVFTLVALTLTSFGPVLADDPTAEREALEAELAELEDLIAEYEKDISKTEAEKENLEDQIYLLKQQIEKTNLQIYQSNLSITDLKGQISDTEDSIDQTLLEISYSRAELAKILQTIYEEDQKSLLEVLLVEDELSDFFDDLMALEMLNAKSQESLEEVKSLKEYLENQKVSLDDEKSDLENLVKIKTLQKQQSEAAKNETNYYLQLTEAEYQEQVAKKEEVEEQASAIRARIFELVGIPEAPTFGEALDIAKSVEKMTGVRPALLLAVLTQESNIGKNVGQCYLKNTSDGSGVYITSGNYASRVMKPSRDVQPFLNITKELGRDPYVTPVSCPVSYGYGGAMGPAQFIPSTWAMYQDELKQLIGSPADPWNIKDAFLASAVLLKKLGATKTGTASKMYEYEWCSALSYYSGSCSLKNQSLYYFYPDSVMNIAAQYEKDIAEIESAG